MSVAFNQGSQQGEPKFIRERRLRMQQRRVLTRQQYDNEINEALAIASKRTPNNKTIKEYLDELSETFICGSPKDTVRIFKEMISTFKKS